VFLVGVHELVARAAALASKSQAHADYGEGQHPVILKSIALCGGSSVFPYLEQRLVRTVAEGLPGGKEEPGEGGLYKRGGRSNRGAVKVLPASSQQRRYAAWRGGAMMASAAPLGVSAPPPEQVMGIVSDEEAAAAAKERLATAIRKSRLCSPFNGGTGVFPAGPWLRRADHSELSRAYVQAAAKACLV
jgi:hypothetical protein